MQIFDIVIIGAGPAGCSAALSLQHSGLRVGLFEKDQFPRSKICGDGVCDRSINTLRTINPSYVDEFLKMVPSQCISKTALVYKSHMYTLEFSSFGYTCKRYEFDNFLFSLVQRDCKNVEVFQQNPITRIESSGNGYLLANQSGDVYSASLILIANGAKSTIAQFVTGNVFSKANYGVAIRAYYSGVRGMHADTIELHYKKEYFPGYLWVFPLADGTANVGFGYHMQDAQKFSGTIQELMQQWILTDVHLRERFAHAQMVSPMQGGLIPYNTNTFNCSGNNYMICGDAASLIDPISGGGIGSAMLSGHLAATYAIECCAKHDFSAEATKKYEDHLKKRIQKEIKTRYYIQQKISKHPNVLDILSIIGKNTKLLNRIKRWYVK
ncbi:MAG TPA: geranylgeranyl reductase family protein [Bacteroidales bacterium]|nr:geranylgeranyl reductase family protein [Bacteroidales bacterium]